MGIFIFGKKPPKSKVNFDPYKLTIGETEKLTKRELKEIKIREELLKEISNLSNKQEWWFWKLLGGVKNLKKPIEFLNNQYNMNLEIEKITKCLNCFKEIYDNNWWSSLRRTIGRLIPEDPILFFEGFLPIFRLAECLHVISTNARVTPNMINRLRNPEEFESIKYELEILSAFFQAGLDVKPYPKMDSKKVLEGLVISDGDQIYYEATKRNISESKLGKARNIEISIYKWLRKRVHVSIKGHIKILSNFNRLKKKKDELLYIFQQKISSGEFFDFPLIIQNDNFNIYLEKGKEPIDIVLINTTSPILENLLKIWISDTIFGSKSVQLTKGKNNIVIADPGFFWDPSLMEFAIEEIKRQIRIRIKQGKNLNKITAIIIYSIIHFRDGIKHIPHIILLKNLSPFEKELLFQMRNALEKYPDWL